MALVLKKSIFLLLVCTAVLYFAVQPLKTLINLSLPSALPVHYSLNYRILSKNHTDYSPVPETFLLIFFSDFFPFEKQQLFYFSVHGSDGGGTFHLNFWNLYKIWI